MNDVIYWHMLNLVPHIGTVRIQQLIERFGNAHAVWHASDAELREGAIPDKIINALKKTRSTIDVGKEIARLEQLNCRIVTKLDIDYPAPLLTTSDAPALLYMRGSYSAVDHRAIAIVGTRRATRYGRDVTQHLAQELARHQVTVISGTAEGIDAYAHESVIANGGRSIAVLGNGIDVIYPRQHESLIDQIQQNGAVITEYPPGTPPNRSNFPRRNRIISGLSLGVLITEAPLRSGALITASTALEQGIDVFVVPANIFNPLGFGSNRLIQDGAKLVMGVDDILEELNMTYEHQSTQTKMVTIVPDNPTEAAIFNLLGADPLHIDEIIRTSGMSAPEVSATLTVLELKGLAQVSGSMQYCRMVQ